MRTTITIDDGIFDELMDLTEAKTRTEAINLALSEWIRRKKIEKLKALRGKLPLEGNLEDFRLLEVAEAESSYEY
ncbi:MAG: type II toxin-antitoxin system VapB family antitoxin [Acidobacteriota bacterium]|nr:type II toxin-antitoxin system VapB family antitoxin [Acidobacteriota bacterium]